MKKGINTFISNFISTIAAMVPLFSKVWWEACSFTRKNITTAFFQGNFPDQLFQRNLLQLLLLQTFQFWNPDESFWFYFREFSSNIDSPSQCALVKFPYIFIRPHPRCHHSFPYLICCWYEFLWGFGKYRLMRLFLDNFLNDVLIRESVEKLVLEFILCKASLYKSY